MREAATVLYAFCREADDLIDSDPHATAATVDKLRQRLLGIYAEAALDHAVDRALRVVVTEEAIPIRLLEALLEGLLWDAEGRRYETFDALLTYAARVAGSVGVMMTLVMGDLSETVLARACELGMAMQLTNIARDVGEDAGRGRIYLPLEWLRDSGVDPEAWLTRPAASTPIRRVVARLLGEADRLYADANRGIAALPTDCRIAIRTASLVYADIGRSIRQADFDSVTRRAVVPGHRKLWLFLRAIAARFQRRPLPALPPLEATRFLLTDAAPNI